MKNIETKINKKIEYQEVDYLSEYKLSYLLSVMADLATTNALEIGMWNDSLKGKYGWVLSKQTLKLKRPINIEENIDIKTRAKGGSRVLFTRTYDIENQGEKIGGVCSLWTLIDMENRKIIKPQDLGIEIPEIDEFDSYVEKYEPVSRYIETQKVLERQVLYNDVDVNQHMNNAKYIEWALDLLPYDIHKDYYIEQMSMHFKKEIAPLTNVELYFGLKDNQFKIEFKIENQVHFDLSGQLKRRD